MEKTAVTHSYFLIDEFADKLDCLFFLNEILRTTAEPIENKELFILQKQISELYTIFCDICEHKPDNSLAVANRLFGYEE